MKIDPWTELAKAIGQALAKSWAQRRQTELTSKAEAQADRARRKCNDAEGCDEPNETEYEDVADH
jgi:hypothetical protein